MSSISNAHIPYDCILGSAVDLRNTLQTLAKMQKMYANFFDPENPDEHLECKVEQVWKNALLGLKDKLSSETVLDAIKLKMRNFFCSYYDHDLKSVQTNEQIETIANRALEDLKGLPLSKPVQKSNRGMKGPTLLAFYVLNVLSDSRVQSFVLKKTTENEVWANRVYRALSCVTNEINPKLTHHLFYVPEITWVDFDSQTHVTCDGKILPLDPIVLDQMKNQLALISKGCACDLLNSESDDGSQVVMFNERVNGGTLFDFISKQYDLITEDEEKKKVFCRLARLSLFDVLLGNLDRMIRIVEDGSGQYNFTDCEANLDNVLLSQLNGKCSIYAIDNEINVDLIAYPENKARYLVFLESLFANDGFADQLAGNMKTTILAGLEVCDERDLETRKELISCQFKRDLESFLPDIKNEFRKTANYILEMLKKHDDISEIMPIEVREKYPELVESICERFQLFKKLRLTL